jgi:hypothetical protein
MHAKRAIITNLIIASILVAVAYSAKITAIPVHIHHLSLTFFQDFKDTLPSLDAGYLNNNAAYYILATNDTGAPDPNKPLVNITNVWRGLTLQ